MVNYSNNTRESFPLGYLFEKCAISDPSISRWKQLFIFVGLCICSSQPLSRQNKYSIAWQLKMSLFIVFYFHFSFEASTLFCPVSKNKNVMAYFFNVSRFTISHLLLTKQTPRCVNNLAMVLGSIRGRVNINEYNCN